MKLRVRFLQLPILFDATQLAQEVAAIPESAWQPHPMKFAGNDALPLITTDGDPSNDSRSGAMRATPHLLACPYLMQVFDALGATWGRSRLMRLSGNAEVTPHVDTDYYWRDHVRIHVPIVTQPTVRFQCGSEEVNMAAGECWAFDTWSLHSVHNDALRSRIHLVADTVGGVGLLGLMENGRSAATSQPGWSPKLSPPRDFAKPNLAYESRNLPKVMTPWELRDHLGFLLGDVAPGDGRFAPIMQALNRLRVAWHALWAQWGDDDAGRAQYEALVRETSAQITTLGADQVKLTNGMSLGLCLRALIFSVAVGGGGMDTDARNSPETQGPTSSHHPIAAPKISEPSPPPSARTWTVPSTLIGAQRRKPKIDRPIFIVSPPRSGSTLLFETLSAARDVFTIGGESHELIEAIPELGPAAHNWDSNRLTSDDATDATADRLRERFVAALRDRHGQAPSGDPISMLEKTPKNSLRISFLAKVFPGAQFVYLYRDPRPTLASMIEAWTSGRFKTYPQLPGWTGLSWSLLLVPGWRSLVSAPLNRIVAHQWAATTDILIDDLQQLSADQRTTVRYESFITAPQIIIPQLCQSLGLDWDQQLGGTLPASRYTVSPPNEQKWRRAAPEIDDVSHLFVRQEQRALSLLNR